MRYIKLYNAASCSGLLCKKAKKHNIDDNNAFTFECIWIWVLFTYDRKCKIICNKKYKQCTRWSMAFLKITTIYTIMKFWDAIRYISVTV